MLLWILGSLLLLTANATGAGPVLFNRDIRPILSDRCFQCHGPNQEDRKSHLRLDRSDGEEGAYRTRDGRTAVRPRSLEESQLWYRITTNDQMERMPPPSAHKKSLNAEEQQRFRQWILDGAQYQAFWAFVPPVPSPPAQVQDPSWRNGPIDPRVMAQLEKKGLHPMGEADKRTLIRRLTFDLTGLPPSLEEIAAFLADDAPDAYESLVDRLLSREAYGEHMARYWADLVRLGDTNGMHKDFFRDFSTYRSWLIRAFNDNLPFDKFIAYQLAGDLYPDPTRDQLIASGFNRLHLIIDVGTALPEESLHKNVLDRVQAFGTAFLGMTLQCAQCHDHKYDPVSQKEFYQLYAFFNNFDGEPETVRAPERGLQPPFINLTSPEQDKTLGALDEQEDRILAEIKRQKARAQQPAAAPASSVEPSAGAGRTEPPEEATLKSELKGVRKRRDELLAAIPAAMVMRERAEPRPTFLLVRGAYDAPGDRVERNTPACLPPLKEKEGAYTRMDLAQWLVDPKHPLTARVAVNRFWQQLFGVGLVKTSEDFGAQGEWPSHPQLLDDLALRLINSDWNVKQLMRTIVLSKTYRQSSDATPQEYARDPENRDLTRGARYRMDAEMIRDQILFVSGLLNTTMYGQSVKPPQPPGLWEAVSMDAPFTYVADEGDKIYRRSLYTYWRRAMPPPQMTIMNAPSREFCVARRERTNSPLQALLLMNEQEYFKAAQACARKTLAQTHGVPTEGLALLYETITSHRPSPQRLTLLTETLGDFRRLYAEDAELTESLTPELDQWDFHQRVELAAWTMVTHGLLNLELAKVRR